MYTHTRARNDIDIIRVQTSARRLTGIFTWLWRAITWEKNSFWRRRREKKSNVEKNQRWEIHIFIRNRVHAPRGS